jgi:hypothetical protein
MKKPESARVTHLDSQEARIRRAVYMHRDKSAANIAKILAKEHGIKVGVNYPYKVRRRMEKEGFDMGKPTKRRDITRLLKANPEITNDEIFSLIGDPNLKDHDIRAARSKARVPTPGKRRLRRWKKKPKPYPELTAEHHELIKESIPVLRKLIDGMASDRGHTWSYADEVFSELLVQLPRWIVKKPPNLALRPFLRPRVRSGFKSFYENDVIQRTGMPQTDVRNGLKWRRELKAGSTPQQIAERYGTTLKEVMDIVDAINLAFRTYSATERSEEERKRIMDELDSH